MKRGRPRHDDILTPREWQVLSLLREGLANEQIAERLSISVNTTKFHVAEIFSKLGVSNRAEAARWQGEPRRALLPLPFVLKWPTLLVAVTAVSAVLLFVLVSFGDSESEIGGDVADLGSGALADFETRPTPTPGPPFSSRATDIEFMVCIDDHVWTRPSLSEQVQVINADKRFAPFGEIAQSQFEASFYIGAGPATGRGNLLSKMVLFSGLWSRGDGQSLQKELATGCPDPPSMATTPKRIDLFLFGYGATDARWDGEATLITVESRAAGFQAIQLRYPGDIAGSAPLFFVDTSGRAVGRIEENPFWSTAP